MGKRVSGRTEEGKMNGFLSGTWDKYPAKGGMFLECYPTTPLLLSITFLLVLFDSSISILIPYSENFSIFGYIFYLLIYDFVLEQYNFFLFFTRLAQYCTWLVSNTLSSNSCNLWSNMKIYPSLVHLISKRSLN